MSTPGLDPFWETELYGKGQHLNRYPFDAVVTFIFRHYPRHKPRSQTRILEIGCGAGNNLWFAAREGFNVTGIDGSRTAIDYARRRFAEDGLHGHFETGDFTALPYDEGTFDLTIDRGSIVCCGRSAARQAVGEVRRVLCERGRFFFNPYSVRHSSLAMSDPGPDGLRVNVRGGSLVGTGQLCFYDKDDVLGVLCPGWKVLSMDHFESSAHVPTTNLVHADWRVVAEKVSLSPDDHILRPAGQADAAKIFAWRNDPWIVSFSSSGKPVTLNEHQAWYESALDRSAHLLFVVLTDDGVEAGTVRVDRGVAEGLVTIYLLRPFTHHGLGPRAIDAACRRAFAEWPDAIVIRARMRRENATYAKALRRAGFVIDQGAGDVAHIEMTRSRE